MAIDLTMLFDRVRALIDAQEDEIAYLGVSLRDRLLDIAQEWSESSLDPEQYTQIANILRAGQSCQKNNSFRTEIRNLLQAEIIRRVQDEFPLVTSITDALIYLYQYMDDNSETVLKNTVTVTPASPTGKDKLLASNINGAAVPTEFILPETIYGVATASGVLLSSEVVIPGLNYDWPGGSGLRQTIPRSVTSIAPGTFDSFNETAGSGHPVSWEVATGDVGVTLLNTEFESQTVTIAGTPTDGWYTLTLTDADGGFQTTDPLSFEATGAEVQAAINALTGWESVEVETTGDTPDYEHTVTFTGVAGDIATMTSHEEFDTGSVTIGAGAAVDTTAVEARSLKIIGDGAELTTIRTKVSLLPNTVYCFGVMLRKIAATTGIVRFRLVNPDHTLISDDAGTANSVSVDISTLTTSFAATTAFWRTPETVLAGSKLEIALTTAINAAKVLYIDNLLLWGAIAVENSGLFLGLYPIEQADLGNDEYEVVVANNLAGRIQTMFGRHFNSQLPSATGGSETIVDT